MEKPWKSSQIKRMIKAVAENLDEHDRVVALRNMGPIIAKVESPIERHLYMEYAAKELGIRSVRMVREELKRGVREDAKKNKSNTLEIKWACCQCQAQHTNFRPASPDAHIFKCIECGKMNFVEVSQQRKGG